MAKKKTTKKAATTAKKPTRKAPAPAPTTVVVHDNSTTLVVIGGLIGLALVIGALLFGLSMWRNSTVAQEPVPVNITVNIPTPQPVVNNDPAPTAPVVNNPGPAVPQPETCGLIFPAYSGGVLNTNYDVRVDCWFENGTWHLRGWQFRLQGEAAHSVAIQIPRGDYIFNGRECTLYLDEGRNGQGSANPKVASHGNDIPFSVTVDVAYALVECGDGRSTGFDYWSR